MSTAPVVQESDPILGTDFIREMVRQMRALDTYGVYNGQSPEKILDPFVLTRARRQEIPLVGDPDEEIRKKAMQIAEKSIELAVDLGVRTVMIPGYDIYFGESTIETKKYFLENVKKIAEIAEREGILVGFETMENNFMNTTGKAVQYVNMVDSAYLKIYPDAGNITNAAVENQHDVCEDLSLGKGKLIALHLKETKPGIFREVPFLTGHVQFEKIINTAWSLGVRRYVTELWDVGKENWKEDICFANQSMRTLLDREA